MTALTELRFLAFNGQFDDPIRALNRDEAIDTRFVWYCQRRKLFMIAKERSETLVVQRAEDGDPAQ